MKNESNNTSLAAHIAMRYFLNQTETDFLLISVISAYAGDDEEELYEAMKNIDQYLNQPRDWNK